MKYREEEGGERYGEPWAKRCIEHSEYESAEYDLLEKTDQKGLRSVRFITSFEPQCSAFWDSIIADRRLVQIWAQIIFYLLWYARGVTALKIDYSKIETCEAKNPDSDINVSPYNMIMF